ncbi:MAG: Na+/H+ antiporter subunit E [Actinomycetaceae bacterium]|nr:Na+/H+ antiporter subunit E [Actinomycetaceae bacterium]
MTQPSQPTPTPTPIPTPTSTDTTQAPQVALPRRIWRFLRYRISWQISILLMAAWLILRPSIAPIEIAGGLLVTIGIQLAFPMPRTQGFATLRPLRFLWVVAHFVFDLLVSSIQVAGIVLRQRPPTSAVIRVDLRYASPLYMTIISAMTTLVPGSVVVQAFTGIGRLYLHVLDVEGISGVEEAKRATLQLEKRLLWAFASKEELRQVGLIRSTHPEGGAQ